MTLRYKLGIALCVIAGLLISLATWRAQVWVMDRTDPSPPFRPEQFSGTYAITINWGTWRNRHREQHDFTISFLPNGDLATASQSRPSGTECRVEGWGSCKPRRATFCVSLTYFGGLHQVFDGAIRPDGYISGTFRQETDLIGHVDYGYFRGRRKPTPPPPASSH